MPAAKSPFTRNTFQFLRQLGGNNRKEWMDENRERYRQYIVQPFHRFFDEVTPFVLQLDANFDVSGRTGTNFSRINRDIRFANSTPAFRPKSSPSASAYTPEQSARNQPWP